MFAVESLSNHLSPGSVYRRADLEPWSNAVDRHLKQLLNLGKLKRLSQGVYYCPKKTSFGDSAASLEKLVKAFLKDDRFLIVSPNFYNALGVGLTQLSNETIVYNHKRHGTFDMGGKKIRYLRKNDFPQEVTKAFLFVDLVNNLTKIGESPDKVLKAVGEKVLRLNTKERTSLKQTIRAYAGVRAKKYYATLLDDRRLLYGKALPA